MDSKKWWLSKGIWAGVIGVMVAVYNAALTSLSAQCGVEGGFCVNLPGIPEWVFGILGALGIYGRATATTKIE